MRKPRFILVLFLLLGFCVFLAVPAIDVPETPYDESETMPYEDTSQFSIMAEANAAAASAPVLTCTIPFCFGVSGRRSRSGREINTQFRHFPSLTVLNHSLRC